MQMRVFAIPMDGDDEATEELNRFLRGQKVLSVEKVGVVDHGRHYWSICVEYLPRRVGNASTPRAGAVGVHDAGRPRVDYREILSKEEFVRYAKLRDARKKLAEADGVPVYTILTNAQLAAIACAVPQTKADLGAVEGLGAAKLERYGDALLTVLLTFGCAVPNAPAAESSFVLPAPTVELSATPVAAEV